jgi:glycosyltransferase involved in cell wall biosynthesis
MNIILCKGQFLGPISGADETLVTYATQLQKAGHAVSVLLMYPHLPEDQYYLRLRQADVPVFTLASGAVRSSVRVGRSLILGSSRVLAFLGRQIRTKGHKVVQRLAARYYEQCYDYFRNSAADLIHVVTPDPSSGVMIRAAHAAGIPVIYQELGTPYHPPHFEAFYEQFTSVLPFCSEVAALSPLLAEQCREKLPHSKATSVLPIMTDDTLNGTPDIRRSSDDQLTFGFAARMEELKAPMDLIEAFGRVYRDHPNISLRFAGTGSQKAQVVSRAEELGIVDRCHFTGVYTRPEEKTAFMKSLDVFVLPSLSEGTPNGIIEAMSHGVPVVATAVGGIPDVVTSETGLLIPPGDPAALSQAMLTLIQDGQLRARMGQAAQERYKELFSPEAVLPVIQSIYERVIAKRNGTAPNGNGCTHPWASSHEANQFVGLGN